MLRPLFFFGVDERIAKGQLQGLRDDAVAHLGVVAVRAEMLAAGLAVGLPE